MSFSIGPDVNIREFPFAPSKCMCMYCTVAAKSGAIHVSSSKSPTNRSRNIRRLLSFFFLLRREHVLFLGLLNINKPQIY